jgi:hypothetical protein
MGIIFKKTAFIGFACFASALLWVALYVLTDPTIRFVKTPITVEGTIEDGLLDGENGQVVMYLKTANQAYELVDASNASYLHRAPSRKKKYCVQELISCYLHERVRIVGYTTEKHLRIQKLVFVAVYGDGFSPPPSTPPKLEPAFDAQELVVQDFTVLD